MQTLRMWRRTALLAFSLVSVHLHTFLTLCPLACPYTQALPRAKSYRNGDSLPPFGAAVCINASLLTSRPLARPYTQALQRAEMHRNLGAVDRAASAAAKPTSTHTPTEQQQPQGQTQDQQAPQEPDQQHVQVEQHHGEGHDGGAIGDKEEGGGRGEGTAALAEPPSEPTEPTEPSPAGPSWLPPAPSASQLAVAQHLSQQVS